MSSTNPQPPAEDSKREESMQQQPTAPPSSEPSTPVGPPPTYNEAISAVPYPPIPVPSTKAPYPTSAPYPVTDSSMPLPVTQPAIAPYPVDDGPIPIPMPSTEVVHSSQPMGFSHHTGSPAYRPIVDQPTAGGAYHDEYVHPKTYVVLQDDRGGRRRTDDDDCTCTDWMMCCWCCVESCRCMLLCLECAAACSK